MRCRYALRYFVVDVGIISGSRDCMCSGVFVLYRRARCCILGFYTWSTAYTLRSNQPQLAASSNTCASIKRLHLYTKLRSHLISSMLLARLLARWPIIFPLAPRACSCYAYGYLISLYRNAWVLCTPVSLAPPPGFRSQPHPED